MPAFKRRLVEMGMSGYEAGANDFAGTIYHSCTIRDLKVLFNFGDFRTLDEEVRPGRVYAIVCIMYE
jgi:hypothetical protein